MKSWMLKAKEYVILALRRLGFLGPYSLFFAGSLRNDGWFRSVREVSSVDAEGKPIPWITYPAIEFLRRRVKPEMNVFEYGCGNSTLWWAGLVREVVAIEHDRAWFEKMVSNPNLPPHVKLLHVDLEGEGYPTAIIGHNKLFEIVVVDGRDRVECVKNCVEALTPTGVIILDNSDREQYSQAVDFLLDCGFRKLEFVGLCPIVSVKSETSIFYKTGNTFGI